MKTKIIITILSIITFALLFSIWFGNCNAGELSEQWNNTNRTTWNLYYGAGMFIEQHTLTNVFHVKQLNSARTCFAICGIKEVCDQLCYKGYIKSYNVFDKRKGWESIDWIMTGSGIGFDMILKWSINKFKKPKITIKELGVKKIRCRYKSIKPSNDEFKITKI